jgi:putative IMPACT (imprinted ancient) family translation regulator
VLRGTQIGDIIIVITRYFGGIKLGTGGLVRAYTEAAQNGIVTFKVEYNIIKRIVGIEMPYSLYEQIKRLIQTCEGTIEDESFDIKVMLMVKIPLDALKIFQKQLAELSAGQVKAIELE